MQIEWEWESRCGKRKFPTENDAKRQVKVYNKQDNQFQGQVVYNCYRCKGWHTSTLKRRKNHQLRVMRKQGKDV